MLASFIPLLWVGLAHAQSETAEVSPKPWKVICEKGAPEGTIKAYQAFTQDGINYNLLFVQEKQANGTDKALLTLYSSSYSDVGRLVIVGKRDDRGPSANLQRVAQDGDKPDLVQTEIEISPFLARMGGYSALALQDVETLFWRDDTVLLGLKELPEKAAERCGE